MPNLNNQAAEAVQAGGYYKPAEAPVIRPEARRAYLLAKRILDLFGASLGLLVSSPLLLIIAILIKLSDPKAGVIFKQVRIGLNGRHFHIYKFRTMVVNSEELLPELMSRNEIDGAMFKIKRDPRVTRIGRVLRKLSLDELPQLWNVLKNDMSLVGPRPALPWQVEQYTPYERQRLLVLPGCTGLWQVSGRNGLDFYQMVELDLEYIRRRNLWLDIVLLLKTVRAVLSAENAY
jgi:lipopolysaccharide/colanic/teichoic acid biosynthesis glycosyltransferase